MAFTPVLKKFVADLVKTNPKFTIKAAKIWLHIICEGKTLAKVKLEAPHEIFRGQGRKWIGIIDNKNYGQDLYDSKGFHGTRTQKPTKITSIYESEGVEVFEDHKTGDWLFQLPHDVLVLLFLYLRQSKGTTCYRGNIGSLVLVNKASLLLLGSNGEIWKTFGCNTNLERKIWLGSHIYQVSKNSLIQIAEKRFQAIGYSNAGVIPVLLENVVYFLDKKFEEHFLFPRINLTTCFVKKLFLNSITVLDHASSNFFLLYTLYILYFDGNLYAVEFIAKYDYEFQYAKEFIDKNYEPVQVAKNITDITMCDNFVILVQEAKILICPNTRYNFLLQKTYPIYPDFIVTAVSVKKNYPQTNIFVIDNKSRIWCVTIEVLLQRETPSIVNGEVIFSKYHNDSVIVLNTTEMNWRGKFNTLSQDAEIVATDDKCYQIKHEKKKILFATARLRIISTFLSRYYCIL